MPAQREYFDQEQAVTRQYLQGQTTLEAAARRLAEITSAMLVDDEAWAELEARDGDDSRSRATIAGELHWLDALVPGASEEDKLKVQQLFDRVMAELRKRDGLTSA